MTIECSSTVARSASRVRSPLFAVPCIIAGYILQAAEAASHRLRMARQRPVPIAGSEQT